MSPVRNRKHIARFEGISGDKFTFSGSIARVSVRSGVLRSGGRIKTRDGRLWTDIQFIRFDPVRCDCLLGCSQVELLVANQFMKLAFEPVFNLGVPR